MEKIFKHLKSDKFKKLGSNFFYLFLLQVSSVLIPFILFPHLIRVLSDSNFGLVVLSLSLTQFLSIVVDFGYNLSATPIIAKNLDSPKRISFIFCNAMYGRFLILLVTFFVFLISCFFIPSLREDFWFHQISFLFVIGAFMFPVWFFQGVQQMKFITIVGVATKGISTILAFFFIGNNSQYIWYPFFLGIAAILSGIFALYIIFSKFNIKLIPVRWRFIRNSLKESAGFFLSRLSASYLLFINPFLLSIFVGKSVVGFYGIAEKFYNFFQSAYRPVVAVLYPYMAQKKDFKLFKRLFIAICLFNTLICGFSYMYIELALGLIFTTYSPMTVEIFRILVIAAFFFVPSQLLGYPFLSALGYGKEANLSVIITTLLHALILFLVLLFFAIDVYLLAYLVIFVQVGILSVRLYYISRNKINELVY